MTDFLINLAGISACMAVVVMILCLLSKPLKKLSAASRYLLWTLIILRLCIPVSAGLIPTVVNIPLPAEKNASEAAETKSYTEHILQTEQNNPVADVSPSTDPAIPFETEADPIPETTAPIITPAETDARTEIILSSPDEKFEEVAETAHSIDLSIISSVIFYAWCAGVLVSLIWSFAEYTRYKKYIYKSLYAADEDLSLTYNQLCSELALKKCPTLRLSENAKSPMLLGYMHPTIIFPATLTNDASLKGLLCHELYHYKRGDLWIKLLAIIARGMHWFNPAAYVSVAMLNEEMELSCDAKALAGMDNSERLNYGESMLHVVKSCNEKSAPLTTHFNPEKNAVKERLMNIFDNTKKRRGTAIICAVLALCIISGSIIGCYHKPIENNVTTNADEINSPDPGNSSERTDDWKAVYGKHLMKNQVGMIDTMSYEGGKGYFALKYITNAEVPDLIVTDNRGRSIIWSAVNGELRSAEFLFGGTGPMQYDYSNVKYATGEKLYFKYENCWLVFDRTERENKAPYHILKCRLEFDEEGYSFEEYNREKMLDDAWAHVREVETVQLSKEEYKAKLDELGLYEESFDTVSFDDFVSLTPANIEKLLHYKASDPENAPDGAIFSVNDLDKMDWKGWDDYTVTTIRDFLCAIIEGDGDAISASYGVSEDVADALATIEFGDYYIYTDYNSEYHPSPYVYLVADVLNGGKTSLAAECQIFKLEMGMYTTFTPLNRSRNFIKDRHYQELLEGYLNIAGFKNLRRAEDVSSEDMREYSINVLDFIGFYYTRTTDKSFTRKDIEDLAYKIFGLTDYSGFDKVFEIDENGYAQFAYGHGGINYYYRYIERTENSATIQFYADPGYIVESHRVKYTFDGKDPVVLVSVETLNESPYQMFGYAI